MAIEREDESILSDQEFKKKGQLVAKNVETKAFHILHVCRISVSFLSARSRMIDRLFAGEGTARV